MIKQKIVLFFPATVVEQPFIYNLIKDFDWMVTILKADINPRKEGRMVLEVTADEESYQKGMEHLQTQGVNLSPLEQEIAWVEERCTQCGACAVICPTKALTVKRPEMTISFDDSKCVVCEHCLKACPARAVESRY